MIYFHVFNLKVCSNTITQGYVFFFKKRSCLAPCAIGEHPVTYIYAG